MLNKKYVKEIAETIKQQLLGVNGSSVVGSWGVSKYTPMEYKGMPALAISVEARLFTGDVIVALNGADYYEMYLCKAGEKDKCICEEADFIEFGAIIDREIEVGNNPEEYQKFCDAETARVFGISLN